MWTVFPNPLPGVRATAPQLPKRAEGACTWAVISPLSAFIPLSASSFFAGEWGEMLTSVLLKSPCPCFPRRGPCSGFAFKCCCFLSLCFLSSPVSQSTQVSQQTPKTRAERCCWCCGEQQNSKLDPALSLQAEWQLGSQGQLTHGGASTLMAAPVSTSWKGAGRAALDFTTQA